jgi:hypothetical protein
VPERTFGLSDMAVFAGLVLVAAGLWLILPALGLIWLGAALLVIVRTSG